MHHQEEMYDRRVKGDSVVSCYNDMFSCCTQGCHVNFTNPGKDLIQYSEDYGTDSV